MAERPSDEARRTEAVVRRESRAGARVASFVALGLLVLLAIAIAVVWIERRPIATHFLKGEFERRGVTASYHLDRVGFRTQEVSNLVIGDPRRPDLVARHAIIQMRLKWDGSFEVYRSLRARRSPARAAGPRQGQLGPDRQAAAAAEQQAVRACPISSLDVADSSIALATPFGPVGVALEGNGKLSGGFKGRAGGRQPAA